MTKLKYQFQLIQAIRNFFLNENFVDVLTPPAVENPGMETHIHPFQLYSPHSSKQKDLYLHSSPEFFMKELLSSPDFEKIFTISYCFRDEPHSEIHREQFLMLEWYRKNEYYTQIMNDIEKLIEFLQSHLKFINQKQYSFQRATIKEIFEEYLKINILNFLETKDLKELIQKDFPDVPLPSAECSWDDYYFLLFLNKIESQLENIPYLLLYEFPHHLKALSTVSSTNPKVCERFEVYMSGIEICNCFNELTNYQEQVKRFQEQADEKNKLYGYILPQPKRFLNVLNKGYPQSTGVALGVERLFKVLTNTTNPFFD